MTENKETNPPDIWQKECQEIINTKKISAIHKIKHWIDIFDGVARYDQTIEPKQKYTLILGITLLVFGVLTICFFVLFEELERVPFSLIFIAPAILFIRKHKQLGITNVENHFRLYALPLFHIFQHEASADTQLTLAADFNIAEQKTYLFEPIAKDKDYVSPDNINFYKITWLNAALAFADKSQVEISITDLIRVRTIRRRNRRGKLKLKIKRKIKQTITVKILFDKTQYKPSSETSKTQNLVEQADVYAIKLKSQNVIKTTNKNINYDEYIDINPLLSAIAQAYTAVKPI
jgi:hypothetical protein